MPRTPLIYTVLGVDPLNDNRCCGLRKDGMPCNNVVAIASRQSASSLLKECSNLPSTSRQLQQNFKSAARLLLCKRWHQDQYMNVCRQWCQAWDRPEPEYESASDSESEDEIVATNNSRFITGPLVGNMNVESIHINSEQSAYEKLVLSILRSDISNDAKVSILEGVSGSNARNANNVNTRPRLALTSTMGAIEAPTSVSTGASRRDNHIRSSTSSQASNQLVRLSSALSTTTTNSSSPSSSTTAHRSSSREQPVTPTRHQPNRSSSSSSRSTAEVAHDRHSHAECGICMEPYDNENDAFWECRQCRNRTHLECHTQWRTANSERTRCVYCRAVVRDRS